MENRDGGGIGLRRALAAAALGAALLGAAPRPARTAVEEIPGLAAWWRLDWNGTDEEGGPAAVLEGGASYGPGRRGQALVLDGVDDAATVPVHPALGPLDAITVAAWVKIEDGSSIQKPILAKSYTAASQPHYQYALTWWASQGTIGFYLGIGGVYRFLGVDSLDIQGRWAHVAGTYDGTAMRVYVDGVLRGTMAQTGSMTEYGSTLAIGRYHHNAGTLQGSIDEIAIFDRGLAADEVMALAFPTPLPPSDLQAVAGEDGGVSLSWTDASDDETGFEIERDSGGGFEGIATLPDGSTGWEDGTAAAGAAHVYRVRAVNAHGASAWTPEIGVVLPGAVVVSLDRGAVSLGARAGDDRADLRGRIEGEGQAWDGPLPDAAEVRFSLVAGSAEFLRTVEAGDAGWRRDDLRFRYRPSRGGKPRWSLDVDLARGRWAFRASRADLDGFDPAEVAVTLAIGDREGVDTDAWTEAKEGARFRFRDR